MSKSHGWKTVLYVNGGQVVVNQDALQRLRNLGGKP